MPPNDFPTRMPPGYATPVNAARSNESLDPVHEQRQSNDQQPYKTTYSRSSRPNEANMARLIYAQKKTAHGQQSLASLEMLAQNAMTQFDHGRSLYFHNEQMKNINDLNTQGFTTLAQYTRQAKAAMDQMHFKLYELCYGKLSPPNEDYQCLSVKQARAIFKSLDKLGEQKKSQQAKLVVYPQHNIGELASRRESSWLHRRKNDAKDFFHPDKKIAVEQLRISQRLSTSYDIVPQQRHPYRPPPVVGQFSVKVSRDALPGLLDKLPEVLDIYCDNVGKVRVDPNTQTVVFSLTRRDQDQQICQSLGGILARKLPDTAWLPPAMPGQLPVYKPSNASRSNPPMGSYAEVRRKPGQKTETIAMMQARQMATAIQTCFSRFGNDPARRQADLGEILKSVMASEGYDLSGGACSVLGNV